MAKLSKPQLVYTLASFSRVASVISVVIGCLVLSGWAFDIALLKSVGPGFPTMKANTAACFLFAGFSLLLWHRSDATASPNSGATRRVAVVLAGAVITIAAITLSQYLFNWNAGIDELLFRVPSSTDTEFPGRMSPATAFNFVLIGSALLLLSSRQRYTVTAQALATIVMIFSLLILLAYLFNIGHFAELHQVKLFSLAAVHSAFTFVVLSAGLLTLRADRGWVSAFVQDTPSAKIGRHFLVATLLVLPLIAELRIIGQNVGLYGTYFGITILTVSSMTIFSLLNWYGTRTGNTADKKISNLNRTYAVLSGINTLIVRVRSQEELFGEACKVAREVGKFPWAWIATIDPHVRRGDLVAWRSTNEKLLTSLQSRLSFGADASEDSSLIGRAISTMTAVVLNDIDNGSDLSINDALRNKELREHGIRSLVLLPLIVSGEVVGIFALHAEAAGFFDETEMRLLLELAGDISFAINNIEKEAKLNYLAYYDALTDLPNSTLFHERLQQAVLEADRTDQKLAVTIFDIDHFKTINDALGRTLGDELLRQIVARMKVHPGIAERFARINADRFAVFSPGFRSADEVARKIEQKIGGVFAPPFMLRDNELRVSAKYGVALFPDDGADANALFKNAESALKKAKNSGERYLFYTQEMTARVAERLAFENKLIQALEKNELVLHYQPKVDSETRHIYGVEALMRWQSPELGLVPPMEFIPLMEETGMIVEAGAWALRQANLDYRRWVEQGVRAPRIAVNVSPIQLHHREFGEVLKTAIAGVSTGIDLEITESGIMENVAANIEKLNLAREAGMDIAVDDFGTGYSSLRYLAQLPVQILKIDRSFIITMLDDPNTMVLVSTIISLAHSLKLKVVAEGVETEEQAKVLRDLRCNQIQGYLISQPVTWERMLVLLAQDMERKTASI